MKTKLWSILFTVFAAASAFAAGDIYEIIPSDEYGHQRLPYADYEHPIKTVGSESYYFTLRLQVRNSGGQNPNLLALQRYFKLVHTNPFAKEEYDASVEENRFGIGVFVSGKVTGTGDIVDSGKLQYASLVQIVPNAASATNFFDCVFEYKMEPGHFALPVRLAVEDTDSMTHITTIRPANDSGDSCRYHFRNTDKWEIRFYDTKDAAQSDKPVVWTITGSETPRLKPNGTTGYTPAGDYSLAGAGIYVQTVDFDQTYWEDNDFWREVPMGDEITCPVHAFAEASGVKEDTTLYVWSMNEDTVKIVGGEPVEIITNYVSGLPQKATVTIGTVEMRGGTAYADFNVLGVMSNGIASVVMSSWKGFRYDVNNDRILDYKTIPVKCGDMPVPSVEISFNKDYPKAPSWKSHSAPASTNYFDRAADVIPLYVTLTQPHESAVTVGVVVKYEAATGTPVDPIAERFVSVSDNGEEFIESSRYCTNVTFAAGETQKTLYVYPLGGNADTRTSGISFTPEILSSVTPVTYEIGKPALLKIDSTHVPVIYTPENNQDYGLVSGAAGEGFDIELFVNDCFRDMKNTNGFLVSFGGALKGQTATNIVFKIGEALDLTLTGYPKKIEGQQKGTITVQEPGGGKKAQVQIFFTVSVEKDKLVYVDLYNTTAASSKCEETVFAEGAGPIPMFYVNEPMAAGESIYFFLKPCNDASSNLVSCAAFTQGIELVGGQTNTVRSQAFALNLLDGCNATEVGSLQYEIIARTGPTLDSPESILYTPAKKLVINVQNVNPVLQAVKINGASEAVENNPEVVWKHAVSAQVGVPFQAQMSDPAKYFDVSNGLMTVWCFTDGRSSNQYRYEFAKVTNATEIVTVDHEFTYAGGATQEVAVVALDKDMLRAITGSYDYKPVTQAQIGELWTALNDKSKSYYAQSYRFKVAVGKRPSVTVYFPGNENKDELFIEENARQTEKKGKLCFELTEPAEEELEIKVTVTSLDETGNPGNLELVKYDFRIPEGGTEPKKSTDYNGGVNFVYDTLDGTAGSFNDGFYVKVEVTSDVPKGKDYFDYGEGWVYVENMPPTILPPQPANPTTNRTVVIDEDFEIVWSASDVLKDLNPDDPAELTCRWYDNGMEIKSAASRITSKDEQTTTLRFTGEGDHEVMLVVTDKEGENYNGKAERVWYYYIAPVKLLEIKPFKPTAATKSRYGTAAGVGLGRVYADTQKYVVEGFVHAWTYNVGIDYANVSAWGYPSKYDTAGNPVPYHDDGTLMPSPDRDVPLMANGNSWPAGSTIVPEDCYELDGLYDSYFYRWVHIGYPMTGGISTNEYEVVQPTTDPLAEVKTQVGLDPYVSGKLSSYAKRTLEAIFSRELYPSDNCGDINADGIPDLYVGAYMFTVFDESANMIGSDVAPLDKYNTDGDFLPDALGASFQSFVPGTTNDWNRPFNALTEIRGFGSCLNDANWIPQLKKIAGLKIKSDLKFIEPEFDALGEVINGSTLTLAEYIAFTNYCDRMGWDPADEAHWGIKQVGGAWSYVNSWSPERPTDPTLYDTDDDGMPDGFEYFVWYYAHVGVVDANGRNWTRLTGRRYVPLRPCEPEIIDSAAIERAYDPLVPNTDLITADTDNDGLPDLVEFVLGSNPFDFDTDGDGLPDGYEVNVSLTDPLRVVSDSASGSDNTQNPDYDAMAIVIPEKATAVSYLVDGVTNYLVCAQADAFTIEEGKITGVAGTVYTAWRYWGVGKDDMPRFCVGREITDENLYMGVEIAGEPYPVEMLFLHFHVYQTYGFDPRTGWNVPPFYMGHLINSTPFTAMDEFLVLAFYLNAGGSVPTGVDAADWTFYQQGGTIAPVPAGSSSSTVLINLWNYATTSPVTADTDHDGMPDGWELYTQAGKRSDAIIDALGSDLTAVEQLFGAASPYSPIEDFAKIAGTVAADPDPPMTGDGLDFPHEFSGIECTAAASRGNTVFELLNPEWKNKIWPTDPWNQDTDNDGIADGAEGQLFIYGTNDHASADCWDTVAGGGLNPFSWDTDDDGLPDTWEAEFPGSYMKVTTVLVDQDGNTISNVSEEASWQGGMDGTAKDAGLDYDNDGLMNWQEYLVAAMRGWRYDDTVSTWDLHRTSDIDFGNFTDDDWYDFLLNPASPNFCHTFGNQRFDMGVYFSCATNIFERGVSPALPGAAYGAMYMFADGYYHDLRIEAMTSDDSHNRWTRGKDGVLYVVTRGYPALYCSTDPRCQDTDGDGMDDFYELFHGLNPILAMAGYAGEPGLSPRDVVWESWVASGMPPGEFAWNATCNWWCGDFVSVGYTRDDYLPLHVKDDSGYDFFQFPWLAGMTHVDFDGDNLRNQQECILANVQAANSYLHTDPSPLWATDIDFVDSFVHRWYYAKNPGYAITVTGIGVPEYFEHDGVRYYFKDFPWLHYDPDLGMILPDAAPVNRWGSVTVAFSAEQNEGYDSDHDYLGDFEEAQGKTKASSDPQQSDDPLRRQAMWFGGAGDPGFLQTPIPMDEIDGDGTRGDLRRDFLYYTVECWAKADAESLGSGLHTCVERATASGISGPADETFLRKNFLIGIRNGRWYTMFDNTGTDAKQQVEITDGPKATTNWTHVAATYDGYALRLYVDGVCRNIHDTQLMPEHGLSAITVTEYSEMNGLQIPWQDARVYPRWMNSIVIGASACTIEGICFDLQWLLRNQSLVPTPPHVYPVPTTINDYNSFFKGYIDEVRIWDGARKENEISNDYNARTRYTPALAAEKQQEVLARWLDGASRAPLPNATELPADLRFHWSFDHVAGAVKPEDVITAPAGFQTLGQVVDAKAYWARPLGWTSVWLDNLDPSIQSKVYTDHAWVPWIDNTVAHLPRPDGTTLDSVYWAEGYAGATPAAKAGYSMFAFKRTAEVFSYWLQATWLSGNLELSQPTSQNLTGAIGKGDEHIFTLRGKMTIGGNLLPFGSAFPKRISATEGGMWDQQGAADAWAQNGEDGTHNGLPDWWEEYARENYADLEPGEPFLWDSPVDYYGITMPAWEAYKRDLAKGMLPDGKYHDGKNTPDDYRDTRDNDHDGILDWWEDIYRIDTGSYEDAHADADNDGLSNYVEYMLSEVFDLRNSKGTPLVFDPKNPCSVNSNVSDYFYRLGSLYVGEIFADHDRISDQWEQKYFDTLSPYVFDAGGDPDEDGWSNYAEFQAGTDPTLTGSIGIDEVQIDEYPIPTIEVSVNYEGNQNVIGQPLVIKAWHDPKLESIPDAVWSVGKGQESTQTVNGNTNNVAGTKYIGMNPNKEILFHLSPGSIVKGSVKFEYKDVNWYLYDMLSGQSWVFDAITAVWVECLYDREIAGSSNKGEIIDKFTTKAVGSIDYTTGAVTLDLTAVSDYVLIDGDISQSVVAADDQQLVSIYNLDKSYIRVKWNAKPITGGKSATYYLSDADDPTSSLNSLGHVKEGFNTFIAFYDFDGNGKYTAGEPYGMVRNVDVGWNYAKVKIELTDTSAVSPRFNSQDGTNDREVLYGTESGNYDPSKIVIGSISGGKYERVRVIRTMIDDLDVVDKNIPARIVLDKMIYIDDEQLYITEADFLKDGQFDLDWETLATDIAAGKTEGMAINSIGYRIVLGNGTVKNTETNNLLGLVFRRMFDVKEVYTDVTQKPVCIGPGIVNSASPTFSWYVPNGLNSYTAFEINIYEGKTKVWNSGYQLIPARVRDDTYGWRYDWTAPIFAGDKLLNGKVFKNNANYLWEVRVTNARFRNIANWSYPADFRMNVFTNSVDYGTINVAVRHYGPAEIRSSGVIRVQAYETPDFSGTPVAQGYVKSLDDVGSAKAVVSGNASLLGLPAGNYYIRAFVDSNNDGICQDWETWGYTCARDHDTGLIYSPRSVQVGPEVGIYNTAVVYLEDSDTDNDNLPDAWEYALYGSLDVIGVTALDESLANGVAVKKSLAGTITAKGGLSGGLSILTMRSLSSPYVAALACGVPVTAGESAEQVTASLYAAAAELDDENTEVEITSVSLDTDNRVVHVEVAGTLACAESPAMALYSFSGTADKTYEFQLLRKNTLMDAEWQEVTRFSFTLGLNEKGLDIALPDDVDINSGFFMLKPVEK